jgi:hypothetical protein
MSEELIRRLMIRLRDSESGPCVKELEDQVAEPSGEERVVVGDAVLAAAVDVAADQLAERPARLQVFAPARLSTAAYQRSPEMDLARCR